jgi:hypothetical protein
MGLAQRRDHEVEVPLFIQGLTPGKPAGENRVDQRMPPEPATGSLLPSEKETLKAGR